MRNLPVIATVLLLATSFLACAKNPAPSPVAAITNSGVRYIAPNDSGLRPYVEAWDVDSGKRLWAKTVARHYYVPPFGTECMHFEYLNSTALQNDTLILTSDRARTYALNIRTRTVRCVKTKEPAARGA
jgi:hypothetical protein